MSSTFFMRGGSPGARRRLAPTARGGRSFHPLVFLCGETYSRGLKRCGGVRGPGPRGVAPGAALVWGEEEKAGRVARLGRGCLSDRVGRGCDQVEVVGDFEPQRRRAELPPLRRGVVEYDLLVVPHR